MPDTWLRGGDQRRAKREKQAREDARAKFDVALAPEDVRRMAVECLVGEHGDPVSTHHGQVESRFYRVELGGAMAYARVLPESRELSGFLTREEWAERLARRVAATHRDKHE